MLIHFTRSCKTILKMFNCGTGQQGKQGKQQSTDYTDF